MAKPQTPMPGASGPWGTTLDFQALEFQAPPTMAPTVREGGNPTLYPQVAPPDGYPLVNFTQVDADAKAEREYVADTENRTAVYSPLPPHEQVVNAPQSRFALPNIAQPTQAQLDAQNPRKRKGRR